MLKSVGLADLLKAWERLGEACRIGSIAEVLGFCVDAHVDQTKPNPPGPPALPDESIQPRQIEELLASLPASTIEFYLEYQEAESEFAANSVALIDAKPLDPDPKELRVPRKPLFAPGLVRDILRRSLSTPMATNQLDLDRLVQMVSRGEGLRKVCTFRPSLRHGVQVLRDIGESMSHFIEDQVDLVDFIRRLVGEDLVEELRSIGVPGRCWDSNGRCEYRPPAPSIPVLILSDLGIARTPFLDRGSTPSNWCKFLNKLKAAGNPRVVYLPNRTDRVPRALRNLADFHPWDRPLLSIVRAKVANTKSSTGQDGLPMAEMLNYLRSRRNGLFDLAICLSPAARIEPELLRMARLELTPWVDASAELEFYYSGMVETTGLPYTVFVPEVQRLLLRELAMDGSRLRASTRFLEEYRVAQQAPIVIPVEEHINILQCREMREAKDLDDAELDIEALKAALAPVLRTLTDQSVDRDTTGIAHWALDIEPRLPQRLRDTSFVRHMLVAAQMQVGVRVLPIDADSGELARLGNLLPSELRRIEIGIRWTDEGLYLSDPAVEEDQRIQLVDTHPRIFWLESADEGASSGQHYELDVGHWVHVPSDQFLKEPRTLAKRLMPPNIHIRTLAGDIWILKPSGPELRQLKRDLNRFQEYFEIVHADTTGIMEVAYRMRYQYLCVQNGYEDADAFPDEMQRDEFDSHSVHFLIRDQQTGQHLGLARMILPDPVNPEKPLPFELWPENIENDAKIDLSGLPRESLAEVGPFFMLEVDHSKRQALAQDIDVDQPQGPRRHLMIVWGMLAGLLRMSVQHNITHWVWLMEPELLQIVERLYGVHVGRVGPLVDMHGKRQQSVFVVEEVLEEMGKISAELLKKLIY